MSDAELQCPRCGAVIPLTEALSRQIRAGIEADVAAAHQQALREAEERARRDAEQALQTRLATVNAELDLHAQRARAAEARELELKRRTMELEEAQRTAAERIRLELEDTLRRENEARVQMLLEEATNRARSETALELRLANEQLAEERRKLAEAQCNELALRQQAAALEERARALDLEVARKLAEEKQTLEESIRRTAAEEQALKLAEKDKQVEDLKKLVDEMKRKSEQGSQEAQGEVLELDIQTVLSARFPTDEIREVKKGARGADLVQVVRNDVLTECGSIVWEAKNAKNWQPAWIDKLKDDQREAGAALAVLVTASLPPEVRGFGFHDGVWVTDLACYPALALALRHQLIEAARARVVATGVGAKMEALYQYLSGHEFRHRVEAIVEAFTGMQAQLAREKRAMAKQWAEREKQIERVIASTTGMYGALAGIIGSGLPSIPALEMDALPGPEEDIE